MISNTSSETDFFRGCGCKAEALELIRSFTSHCGREREDAPARGCSRSICSLDWHGLGIRNLIQYMSYWLATRNKMVNLRFLRRCPCIPLITSADLFIGLGDTLLYFSTRDILHPSHGLVVPLLIGFNCTPTWERDACLFLCIIRAAARLRHLDCCWL